MRTPPQPIASAFGASPFRFRFPRAQLTLRPFGLFQTPSEHLISEESNVVEEQVERRKTSVSKKKQKKKKVSFSLGGLASDRHINTLGHFD